MPDPVPKWGGDKVPTYLQRRLLYWIEAHPFGTILFIAVWFLVGCLAIGGGIYQAVPQPGGVYVLNRYTGEISFCVAANCK